MIRSAAVASCVALVLELPLTPSARAEPPPLPTATPAAVGMSAERLARMGEHFRTEVDRNSAAGYVLMVARYGKLVYSTAVGMRDRERQQPMTLDTRFRIESMTKPVTAVAVLMLYEEGRLQLDDPVSRFLPEFADARVYTGVDAQGGFITEPAKRPITVRHLLTQTAGLGYVRGYNPTTPLGKAYDSLQLASLGTLADRVRAVARLPLYFHPGENWSYSFALDVLGRLAEVVSGMPFDRFVKTRLLDPLGMTHTGFFLPRSDLPLLAVAYRHARTGALVPSDLPLADPTDPALPPSGGGGLISTPGDYLRFAQMLANGGSLAGRQYLSPVTVALMSSNQVPDDAMVKYWGEGSKGLGYGLGIGVIVDPAIAPQADLAGDISWGGLLDTHWIVSPKSGVVAVLMAQSDPRPNVYSPRTYVDFRNLLFAAVERLEPASAPDRR